MYIWKIELNDDARASIIEAVLEHFEREPATFKLLHNIYYAIYIYIYIYII